MHIDLLPPKTGLRIRARAIVRRWAILWVCAGAGMFACGYLRYSELRQARDRLALLRSRCQPLYNLQREIRADRQRLLTLQTESRRLQQLQPAEHPIDLLGILVRAARPEEGKLQVQRLNLVARQSSTSGSAASVAAQPSANRARATQPKSMATVSLQGVAADDGVLARFVAALREPGVFERVDLKSSTQLAADKGSSRQYQLECRYENQP